MIAWNMPSSQTYIARPGTRWISSSTPVVLLTPIEVKLSATPRASLADAIVRLRHDLGARVGHGYIVHPGDVQLPLAPGVTAIPFSAL